MEMEMVGVDCEEALLLVKEFEVVSPLNADEEGFAAFSDEEGMDELLGKLSKWRELEFSPPPAPKKSNMSRAEEELSLSVLSAVRGTKEREEE